VQKICADFYVLGHFLRCWRGFAVRSLVESRLKGYKLKTSAALRQLGWIVTLQYFNTQNFEILKSLEQTQESKKIKITSEIFVKMLDGLNFGKRCLLRCFIWIFSELENFEIFLGKF
jgi:hypothetical protein